MTLLLTMASGLNVSLTQTCETRFPSDQPRYVLHGQRGTVPALRDEAHVSSADLGRGEPHRIPYPDDPLSDYTPEFQALATLIARGAEGPTSARSQRRTLAVVQAGYESAATGRPVVLAQRFPDV
ncbi:MAG: hypothetical protein FJ313_07770 [Gemmatimonadetes bacterium]|nr:hypothetical protein [Gemmatimonadota bacterium]